MTQWTMVLDPDDPNDANQPYERDPTRECPHLVPYPRECADCEYYDAQYREAHEETDQSGTGFLMIVEPDEETEHD
jgi:hypothetical protein